MLRLDLAQLFLGAQVDGAEPLAVAPQLLEPLLDRARPRAARRPPRCRRAPRRPAGSVSSISRISCATSAVRRLAASSRSSARACAGARFAHGFERGARGLVGIGERGLGGGAAVGGLRRAASAASICGNQGLALLGEGGGRVGERSALGLRLGGALLERARSGRRRRCGGCPIRRARRRSRRGAARATRPRARAPAPRRALRRAPRAWRRHRGALPRAAPSRSAAEESCSIACVASRLAAIVSSRLAARRTFASASAESRAVIRLASRSAAACASRAAVGLRLRLAPRIAGFAFGRDRGVQFGFGGLDGAALGFGIAARSAKLGVDIGEAVLGGEPARGRGRRIRGGRKAVPAPQIALARHQPLAGLQLRDERRPKRAVDHADLRQPPRKLAPAR